MTPVYIVEWLPSPGIISAVINAFVPTGRSHTGIMIGKCYYELDPTRGHNYNLFDFTDPCCNYLKKNGKYMEFYLLGEYDDDTIAKIRGWWVEKLLKQPGFSVLRFLTFPIDIARQKFYELQFKITGKPTKTIFDTLLPNNEVCSTAVADSLRIAGIDPRPDLSDSVVYPGLLSEDIRDKRVYFPCLG